ncbi:MAG: MerR family transcriptional regulator [Coriobacteriales bacterium]|jgi:DNA-binding transcriptional MerR regulator
MAGMGTMDEGLACEGQGDEGCAAGARPEYRKLKDLRGLFSLSENGFRLYERAGLVRPYRNEDNGYRVATLSDAVQMCNAFNLTHYGIPLKVVHGLITDGDVAGELGELNDVDAALNRQLQELVAKKVHLEWDLHALGAYTRDPLGCAVVTDVDLYYIDLHTQRVEINRDNYDDAVEWWRHAPFVGAGLIVTLGDGPSAETSDVSHGPVVTEDDALRLRLPLSRAVHFCRRGHGYVRGFVRFPVETAPSRDAYAHILSYAEDRGLHLDASRVLHRLLRFRDVDGTAMRLDEAYVPLAEDSAPGARAR